MICSAVAWGDHAMETLSALLAICEGNPPVICEFPSLKASNAELWLFHHGELNKLLNK